MMHIISLERSAEDCQQAGWIAIDVIFSCTIFSEQIIKWGGLGELVYLQSLKEPFFRIANREFLIKGFEGRDRIRVGFQKDFLPPYDIEAFTAFLL